MPIRFGLKNPPPVGEIMFKCRAWESKRGEDFVNVINSRGARGLDHDNAQKRGDISPMQEHKSRFKSYLIAATELAAEAARLRPQLEVLRDLQGRLSDAERVLLFVFVYAQSRNPDQWWISRGSHACSLNKVGFLFSELPVEFRYLRKILANTLEEFCTRYDFKKLPGSIARAIYEWKWGKYNLVLKDRPITPLEMLAAQAEGRRIVTLDMAAALEGRLVDGQRDALEFLLHDLVHADLFFSEGHGEQVRFFKKFQAVVGEDFFTTALERDTEFRRDIEYLISDMNSNVAHMQGLLKASLTKHQLFLESKQPHDTLSDAGRALLEQRWHLLNNQIFL
jgi:hypothetical protein